MTPTDHADAGGEHGGARISLRDGRVSKVLAWCYGSIGMAIVTGTWVAANNLYQINLTLAAYAVSKQEFDRQLVEIRALNERQEDHINAVDRRVYTLEGRNLRGGPDAPATR
jgi:hypothetical protein